MTPTIPGLPGNSAEVEPTREPGRTVSGNKWKEHLLKDEQGWEKSLTGVVGFISPTSEQVMYALLTRLGTTRMVLAEAQGKLEEIELAVLRETPHQGGGSCPQRSCMACRILSPERSKEGE